MPMAGSNTTSQNVNSGSGNPGPGAVANNNAAVGSNKTWELSDYELHRTPQDAVTDGSEIAVSPRALHSELMCPICLDMLHQTMTTKECLHRFCAECIITALRSGNKECPTCRKKLVSKRSLRPDPNFDMLISKIYPSRDEYEAQQQKAMARLSKSHNQLALASSIEEGMKAQSQLRKVQKPGGKGVGSANPNQPNTPTVDNPDGGSSNNAEGNSSTNIGNPASVGNNVATPGASNSNNNNTNTNNNNNNGPPNSIPIPTNANTPTPTSQSASVTPVVIVTPVTVTTDTTTNTTTITTTITTTTTTSTTPTTTTTTTATPTTTTINNNTNNTNSNTNNNGTPIPSNSNQSHVGPSPTKISRTDSVGDNSSNTSGFSDEITEVELVFKPHPDMFAIGPSVPPSHTQTRYIKTSANASVEHLTKYLGMRLALDSQTDAANDTLHNCSIYVSPNGSSFITIPVPQTLSQVCEKYWRVNKPLEMYYSWKKV